VSRREEGAVRKSRWVTALASITVMAAACGGTAESPGAAIEGRAPNVADLWGVWIQVEDPGALGVVVGFAAPGKFSMYDGGEPVEEPRLRGAYSQRGDAIRFTSQGSVGCADGDAWTWRAGISRSGLLHVELAGAPACGLESGIRWTLIRVSPVSAAAQAIQVPTGADGPAPTVDDLGGIWLSLEGGGSSSLLLWLGSDGSFVLDNHGKLFTDPFERGEYELDGRELTFRSGGSDCGDWGWRASVPQDGVLAAVQTLEGVSQCYVPEGTAWTWVRLSPASDVLEGLSIEEAV
jgi:hypothetical protein